jgi:hypothetical protein
MWVFLNASKGDFKGSCGEDVGWQEEEQDPLLEEELGMVFERSEEVHECDEELLLDITPIIASTSLSNLSAFLSIEENLFSYFVTSIGRSWSLNPSQNPYLASLTPPRWRSNFQP